LREYYCELLNRNISIAPEVDSYVALFTKPVNLHLDIMPTYDEYIKAVQRAKNHKSGTDYISIDLLKYSSSKHLNLAVYQIIARIWETVEIPNSFLQLILCSIPKKGDASICENHRGISLISHTSKVLTLLINARMYSYVEEQLILPESQCGFRKGRSTSDMILAVKLIQQHCREKQIPLYLAFLDIAKAYDSVDRETLWKILHSIGIPPKMLALIRMLYGDTAYQVRFKGETSASFLVKQGLKQGCPAACLLFNIFLALLFTSSAPNSSARGSS
jgi:sorting nexin-29